MTVRTLRTSNGKSVETTLTNAEAFGILGTIKSQFAKDLIVKAAKYTLSHDQLTWVHILAMAEVKPAEKTLELKIEQSGMQAINALFAIATTHLKYPKIRLRIKGQKVVLIYNAAKARINITDGGPFGSNKYFGFIAADGAFTAAHQCTDDVRNLLFAFSMSPVGVAKKYAQETGECCFCAKELTEADSVAAGYGPICAKHYGLPHSGMASVRKSA